METKEKKKTPASRKKPVKKGVFNLFGRPAPKKKTGKRPQTRKPASGSDRERREEAARAARIRNMKRQADDALFGSAVFENPAGKLLLFRFAVKKRRIHIGNEARFVPFRTDIMYAQNCGNDKGIAVFTGNTEPFDLQTGKKLFAGSVFLNDLAKGHRSGEKAQRCVFIGSTVENKKADIAFEDQLAFFGEPTT